MNRLFRVLHRWKCKTASQKLALDALRHLGEDRRRAGLFLWHVEAYFRGVDAPEADFRDFTNHVLYPVENWGGAARLALKWYGKTVELLRTADWSEAVYAAGVTVRYATFAFSPPRTGHDEKGLLLRRPVEWCLSRLYDDLVEQSKEEVKPVRIPTGADWLERLVKTAAEDAHCHLRAVTTRFDLEAVAAKPSSLDDELRPLFAGLLTRSAATAGAILARAIDEAGAEPPRYLLGPAGLLSLPSLPLFWLTRSRARTADRKMIRAMRREFAKTGGLDKTLPEDAKAVRETYEVEVLKKAPRSKESPAKQAPPREAPARAAAPKGAARGPERVTPPVLSRGTPPATAAVAKDRPREASQPLAASSPVSAAPSIDPKLVPRLEATGIKTVGQLLAADADRLASSLHPHATASDISSWQDQSRLACAVASLTPAEAQLLVACGVTGPDDLAALSPVELWELVIPVAESPDGRRLLRGGTPPDLNTVTRWIDAAKRPRKAA